MAAFSADPRPAVPVGLVACPIFALAGLGMGLAYSPLSLIVLREAPPETQGAATSALSLSDTLGTALGTGVSGAIIAASVRSTGEPVAGPGRRVRVAIVVGIGGVLLTSRAAGPLDGRRDHRGALAGGPRLTLSGPGSGARSRLRRPARLR